MSVRQEEHAPRIRGRFGVKVVQRTHFDIGWWQTEPVFMEVRFEGTAAEVIELLEMFPELTFTFDGQFYLLWKHIRNALLLSEQNRRFDRVSALVQTGRLQAGPAWVLEDSFLTPGEAQVRNKIIGRKTSMDLGAPARQVDDGSDKFGFPAQTPQILADFTDFHMHTRGQTEEQIQQVAARWVAPNGSFIINMVQPGGYGNCYEFGRKSKEISLRTVDNFRNNYLNRYETADIMLGLMCGGGDHTAIGGRILEDIQAAREAFPDMDFSLGTNNDYAVDLDLDPNLLPVIRGELNSSARQNILRHVDSTRVYLKQMMERLYRTIINADTMVSLMHLKRRVHLEHLLVALERCWSELLVFYSHDAVTGCHVDEVTRYIFAQCDSIEQKLQVIMQMAMAELSGVPYQMAHRNTYGLAPAPKFALWNSLPYERSEVAIVNLPEELHGTFRLTVKVNGRPGEIQRLDATRAAIAVATGSFGSNSIEIEADPRPVPWVRPTVTFMENKYLAVRARPNGTFDIEDKIAHRTMCGLGRLTSHGDRGDEYNRDLLGDEVNSGSARAVSRVTVDGALVQELEIKFDFEVPKRLDDERKVRLGRVTIPVVTTLRLRRGSRMLEINTRIDNRASDQLLRVEFPMGAKLQESRALTVFMVQPHSVPEPTDPNWLTNTPDLEPPFTTFSNLGMVMAGPLVSFNRGLTEYEVYTSPDGTDVYAQTLQRGVGFLSRDDHRMRRPDPDSGKAGAGPQLEVPGAQCLGEQSFDYTIGFTGEASDIEWAQRAQMWQYVFVNAPYGFDSNGIVTGRFDGVVFSALKPSEDGRGVIFRAWAGEKPTWIQLKGEFDAIERVTMAEEPSERHGLHAAHHEVLSALLVRSFD